MNVLIPLFMTKVSCGFPSPAEEYLESKLDLNDLLIQKPSATFFVRAQGDSMIGAGIYNEDLIIIDRSLMVASGKIVLAVVNGEFTLKRYQKNLEKILLSAENPKYPTLVITAEMDFQIWGVATHCVHRL